MIYTQRFRQAQEKAYRQQTASKLFDGIRKLYSSESSPRRWIWELLQNAKDVAKNKVKVEIIFDSNSLEFKHNGKPFLIENITYLIEQVSTKDRNSNKHQENGEEGGVRTTGKFGTGFMTTHLLSKIVELNSVFEDPEENIYKRFQLTLDRSAENVEEMIEAVKKASNVHYNLDDENICPTIPNYQPHQNCDTSFKYKLDEEGLKVAQQGIKDLSNAIVYTLVFIPEIESVAVRDKTNSEEISYKIVKTEQDGGITISHIEKRSGEEVELILIATCSKTIVLDEEAGDVTIAIQLEKKGEKYSLLKLNPNAPLLFCDFPLIGSEKQFNCPVVINSPLLEPTEPRDSVLLDNRNETGGKKNRKIFEETISLYSILLDYAASNWLSPHLLAKSGLPKNTETQWYESQIQSRIREEVLVTPVVDTKNNQKIELKDALIPYSSKSLLEFWELAIALHGDKLPQREDVQDWYSIINLDKNWSKDLRYDLPKLLAEIEEQKNLKNLCLRLNLKGDETIDWLNRVIAFVFKTNQVELLSSEYAILPNQYGQFQLKTQLVKDEGIPEGLKNVLKILDEDWREELLHLKINCQLEQSRKLKNISERINAIIIEKEHPNLRKACYELISLIPDNTNTSKNSKPVNLKNRNRIWQFASDLDENVPEKQTLTDWNTSLWSICDGWILKTLIQDIADFEQITSLQESLQTTTELETVKWLSSFINFIKEIKQASLYSEKAIFPNQKGFLNKKGDLLFDNDIPEELKDVLEKFGSDCRSKLLHREIAGFRNSLSKLSVSDISKEINEIISDEDRDEDDNFRMAIFDLVSYFKKDSKDEKRFYIWQISRDVYGEEIPDKVDIDNLSNFSWKECNKWIVRLIVEEVSQASNLDNLVELLSKTRENTVSWLNNFLCFIHNFDGRHLDGYALMPNQNENFEFRKKLKRDGGIPEELKEIARYLKLQEWNDLLLFKDSNFADAQELIEKSCTANIADIAMEIDNAIRNYQGDKQDNRFRKVVKQLLHWSNSIAESNFEVWFSYFYDHRAEIVLQALGDDETRSNIFDVLQVDSPKLIALADLARQSDITAEDLNRIPEIIGKLKLLKNPKGESCAEEEVIALLEDFGISIPQFIEQESNGAGSSEVSVKKSTEYVELVESAIPLSYGDDGTTYGENAEKYGKLGEHWARKLYEEHLEYTFLEPNDNSGFDLRYQKGSEILRVEVKARDFKSPSIRITQNEWQKMVDYEDSYELLVISHEGEKVLEFIRVQKAWLTLVDILAYLHNQRLSKECYRSNRIENLIGLQLNSRGYGNDIVINWHRLFRDYQHQNIIKYQHSKSSGFQQM